MMSNNEGFFKAVFTTFVMRQIAKIPITIAVISILLFIYKVGFKDSDYNNEIILFVYILSLIIGSFSIVTRYFFRDVRPRLLVIPLEIMLLTFNIILIFHHFNIVISPIFDFLKHSFWLEIAVFLLFFRELTALRVNFRRTFITPPQLFVFSFLSIIVFGGLLLMLPNATYTGIGVVDAFFTSTSAVCVTGLVVVDTGTFFTHFGQIIILVLIQIGGIGIMTFASYFSYFFRGVSSYENQIVLREMTNTERLGEVFSVLKNIIGITFLIEAVGAVLIFYSLDTNLVPLLNDRIFFSAFHAVSGFCNAGFSTLQNSLYDGVFQFNYSLHLIIAGLIIFGGLGFPIIFNVLKLIRIKIVVFFVKIIGKKKKTYYPWILNVNSRIVLITSLVLIVVGTILFYIFEYNNTLSAHSFAGKIVTSFFASVTARTAGFNTVDTAMLGLPAILIITFLMWIGASPGSTGGGIKTTTFAVAILNIINIARGKVRLEVFKREIPGNSVNRAYAIIILSIVVISLSVFFVSFFDPDKRLLDIGFECVSAYSTVGLSRGITADLSAYSKWIIIITMFIGRISMLTVLIAFYKKVASDKLKYPTEDLLIN